MSAIAAMCGREVRTWLRTREDAARQMIPPALMALQAGLACLIHMLELTQEMGVPHRGTLRDFVAHVLEDTFQLGGALVAGERAFWVAARVDAADVRAAPRQRIDFTSDVTAFTRDISSWMTAQLPHHRAEARRLLDNINTHLDQATDGTFRDDSLNELRRQMRDVIPTFERLMDSGLPVWDEQDAGWQHDDGWQQSTSNRAWHW